MIRITDERGRSIDVLAATVETYITELATEIPDGAFDLRDLPPASQARQLADDLAAVGPGETVTAVVEDQAWIEETLRTSAGELVDDVSHVQLGATGVLLELSRA